MGNKVGRRWWSFGAALAVLAVVLAACTPPPNDPGAPPTTLEPLPEPPSSFSVLAYNIAGLPQGISGSNPERNIPLISPLLNEYDVVLTQEDFDWWVPIAGLLDFANYHTRLRADAVHPWRTARHPGPEAVGVDASSRGLLVGDGIGIMAKYPLYDERVAAWHDCFGGALPPGAADCLAMKGFRMMRMVLGDGLEVDVYSLHAEAGGTERDQELQVENFIQLAEAIEEWSEGRAVIVGGDTNLHIDAHPDSGDGRWILNPRLNPQRHPAGVRHLIQRPHERLINPVICLAHLPATDGTFFESTALFGAIGQLGIGISQLNAVDIELPALRHLRLLGFPTRQRGGLDRIIFEHDRPTLLLQCALHLFNQVYIKPIFVVVPNGIPASKFKKGLRDAHDRPFLGSVRPHGGNQRACLFQHVHIVGVRLIPLQHGVFRMMQRPKLAPTETFA